MNDSNKIDNTLISMKLTKTQVGLLSDAIESFYDTEEYMDICDGCQKLITRMHEEFGKMLEDQ